jgi:hypothetical protein
MTDDEFTPRELGLITGNRWAGFSAAEGRKDVLHDVAEGDVPDDVREYILSMGFRERLDEFDDPDAEEDFWRGFSHGVRAFLVESLAKAAKFN